MHFHILWYYCVILWNPYDFKICVCEFLGDLVKQCWRISLKCNRCKEKNDIMQSVFVRELQAYQLCETLDKNQNQPTFKCVHVNLK